MDKSRLVALKDRVLNRLKKEHSNPRFHTRMSDRTAALLNRAVSRETSPSPPYRFRRLDELQNRLTEILALVHPAVTAVGRVIPEAAPQGGFTTEHDVGFSVAVGYPGRQVEEIACGLAVFDVDTGARIRDRQPTRSTGIQAGGSSSDSASATSAPASSACVWPSPSGNPVMSRPQPKARSGCAQLPATCPPSRSPHPRRCVSSARTTRSARPSPGFPRLVQRTLPLQPTPACPGTGRSEAHAPPHRPPPSARPAPASRLRH